MKLAEQIRKDWVAAVKAGDSTKKEVLGLVRSAMSNFKIENKKEEVSDEDMIAILSKEVKSRKESAVEYRKGGAEDRAKQEDAEIEVLQGYLPEQMNSEGVAKAVDEAIKASGASDVKDMGKVMGVLSGKLKGQADMKEVNEVVKKKLAA